ncbi:MAG: GNAT family N-acetyltransferase [Armatimonadia bacterium]|nr:GNAT family N-acetyltransferase [Armatimonadia bacterium]
MGIIYRTHLEGIVPESLDGFFAGWPNPPSPETHLAALRGSSHVVLAIDQASGRVVGFINAISDGVLSAFIPLLEVRPEWQGRGIGRELVRRMLAELEGRYSVDLVCDPELAEFYEPLGFGRLQGMGRRDTRALGKSG